jgi:arsenate reductase
MINVEIFYNPHCSKSRQALATLEQCNDFDINIIDYKQTPPDAQRLTQIADLLGVDIKALIRTEESELPSEPGSTLSDQQACLNWLTQHIDYLQRPIVIFDNHHAIIARPPADLEDFIHTVVNKKPRTC